VGWSCWVRVDFCWPVGFFRPVVFAATGVPATGVPANGAAASGAAASDVAATRIAAPGVAALVLLTDARPVVGLGQGRNAVPNIVAGCVG
jgi:hypothetical protein